MDALRVADKENHDRQPAAKRKMQDAPRAPEGGARFGFRGAVVKRRKSSTSSDSTASSLATEVTDISTATTATTATTAAAGAKARAPRTRSATLRTARGKPAATTAPMVTKRAARPRGAAQSSSAAGAASQLPSPVPAPTGIPSRTPARTPARTPGRARCVDEAAASAARPARREREIAAMCAALEQAEAEVREMLATKITNNKFDYKAKIQQQSDLIKGLRQCVPRLLEAKAEFVARCSALEERLLAAAAASDGRLEELQQEHEEALELVQQLEQRVAAAEEQLTAARQEHCASVAAQEAARRDVAAVQQKLAAAGESNRALQDERAKLLRESEEQTRSIRMLTEDVVGKEQELAQAREAAAVAVREHAQALERLGADARTHAAALEARVAAAAAEVQSKEEAVGALQVEKAELQQQLADLRLSGAAVAAERERAQGDATRLQSELADARAQMAQLQERLSARDGEVGRVLSAFQKSQDMLEARSAAVAEEKTTLQQRLDEAAGELRQQTAALHECERRLAEVARDLAETQRQREQEAAARAAAAAALDDARSEAQALSVRLGAAEERLRNVEEAQAALKAEAKEANDMRAAQKAVSDWEARQLKEQLEEERRAWEAERARAAEDAARAAEAVRAAEERAFALQSELQSLKSNCGVSAESQLQRLCELSQETDHLRRQVVEREQLLREVAEAARRNRELEEQLLRGEAERRKLHNAIQELRGNVRVFVRVRPFLPSEPEAAMDPPPYALDCAPDGVSVVLRKASVDGVKPQRFLFDKSLGPEASQRAVFEEVSQLVQSALDGFNVCLFSYGQTGSGKTHTMQGGSAPDSRGIIPRSVAKVLQCATKLRLEGWEYVIEASFLEIYNETIRDLLNDSNRGGAAATGTSASAHAIKLSPEGGVYVTDLTRVPIAGEADIDRLMARAAACRSVSATDMNERSSRSHSVFTLQLTGSNVRAGQQLRGSLHLVDLAGSERLSRSGATGERLKETQAINKSLSCLADVFTALAQKQKHIPFRNSKLTYLLQPCFSGDGKTLMMVNLAPHDASFHETLCSLRFASQVNQCELGRPKRHTAAAARPVTAPPAAAAAGDADEDDGSSDAGKGAASQSAVGAAAARPATAGGAVAARLKRPLGPSARGGAVGKSVRRA